jgi:hypothetical protein
VPTASARLQRKLDLVAPAFGTPGRLLLDDPRARERAPRFFAAGSYITLAMVPLMEAALHRSRELAADDAVAAGLADYLERHIPEEMHGESPGRAALDDLEALGIDTIALRCEPPPPSMAELIGTLAFWIWHRHPVTILGLLALEAFHPHGPAVEQLVQATGLPRDGFRQLFLHAKLDEHHAKELHRVVDTLPLDREQEELISVAALQTMSTLIDGWLDVVTEGASIGAESRA